MEILSCRTLIRATDLARSREFYRDVLGLATYRQFGDPADPAMVFFAGGGFIEVTAGGQPGHAGVALWLQVRDIAAEHERLRAAGVQIVREPLREPWGLVEMWIDDPDGIRIMLIEVPDDHPLRRDVRPPTAPTG